MELGDTYTYLYKGPYGFSINPERMPCRIMGFTPKRVRINVLDRVNNYYFRATVNKESLVTIHENELSDLHMFEQKHY